MKILVYSDHKWIESSFPFFIEHISKTKGVTVERIDRVPAPTNVPPFEPDPRPERRGNGYLYPHWGWFYYNMTKPAEDKYEIVVWHDTRENGRGYQKGAKRKYNGVYDSYTRDRAFNAVVFASQNQKDSRTIAHHKLYPGMTLFERVFLHEVSHGIARINGSVDYTHFWDYTLHNIPGAFLTYDLTDWKRLRGILSLSERAYLKVKSLVGMETFHPPLDRMNTVSQPYGVPNARYPLTGHHVGVDFAVSVGNRIYAPKDCTISKVGSHAVLGHWCEVDTTFRGTRVWLRYLHLQHRPEKRAYRRGEVIALTGNTGYSTGPHLHWDIRQVEAISTANRQNWREAFINPLDTL